MDPSVHTFLTLISSQSRSPVQRKQTNKELCHSAEITSKSSHGETKTLLSVRCLFHVSVFAFGVMSPITEGTQQAREGVWQLRSPVWPTLIWISRFSFLGLTACGSIKNHADQWVWIVVLQRVVWSSKRDWKSSKLTASSVDSLHSLAKPSGLRRFFWPTKS